MLELVDPEPETVVLELVVVVPRLEAAKCCSYKDSNTQGVASSRIFWRQKLEDNLLDSRSRPCECYILVTNC